MKIIRTRYGRIGAESTYSHDILAEGKAKTGYTDSPTEIQLCVLLTTPDADGSYETMRAVMTPDEVRAVYKLLEHTERVEAILTR